MGRKWTLCFSITQPILSGQMEMNEKVFFFAVEKYSCNFFAMHTASNSNKSKARLSTRE